MKYENLDNLLHQNVSADKFFSSLPDYVQETISARSDNINSEEDLHTYANNLLRGDD